MDKSNPMCITHYSAKVEFQGRGAAHNHGTIWINMDKMEYMFENKMSENPIEYNISDFDSYFNETEIDWKNNIKEAIQICKNTAGPKTFQESFAEDNAKELVRKFALEKLKKPLGFNEVISKFKFVGLKAAFKKFQTHEILAEYEEKAIVNLANKFTSVC